MHHQEQEEPTQGGVHRECHRVGSAELTHPEDAQGQHRLRRPELHDEERRERHQPPAAGQQHRRPDALLAGGDQGVGDPGQAEGAQHGAEHVQVLGRGLVA